MSSDTEAPESAFCDENFRNLLDRVQDGDRSAADELIAAYGPTVLKAVRRHMNQPLRQRFESQDFANDVWASFFNHLSVVERISSEDRLGGFLAKMASHKVIDEGRRRQRQERDEQKLASKEMKEVVRDNRTAASEPTPSQFASANERWDQVTADEDDRTLKLLKLKRSGASRAEIAKELGLSERQIARVMSEVRRKHGNDD